MFAVVRNDVRQADHRLPYKRLRFLTEDQKAPKTKMTWVRANIQKDRRMSDRVRPVQLALLSRIVITNNYDSINNNQIIGNDNKGKCLVMSSFH